MVETGETMFFKHYHLVLVLVLLERQILDNSGDNVIMLYLVGSINILATHPDICFIYPVIFPSLLNLI